MSQRLRVASVISATFGTLSLAVPMMTLQLGQSTFSPLNNRSATSFLFRHLGDVAYYHGFFALGMSSMLVISGAAIYYGRDYGVSILKSAIWLQLFHIMLLEVAWLVSVLQEISGRIEMTVLMVSGTLMMIVAGIVVSLCLLLALHFLNKQS
jgi:hypothetical protein